jgi:transposase InsO family protein
VWSWDITYLKSSIKGLFYYLYLIIDIYSRKIVGWRVERYESQDYSSALIADTALKEGVSKDLTLHSDNGSPMKPTTNACYPSMAWRYAFILANFVSTFFKVAF